ncbi:hypothetical protein MVEN_00739300 [Mycena venus]|uniref:F-box domain-containing protein n=1 Tax=Mycena venus TaxID=2733690 RepID=A0A8H6YKT2_9AGAR|nr:hypothetical protein MVEN_00739300 [Mycena venus]
MPPRARTKRRQLVSPDIPPRNSTQLPQELIDTIIDEFDPSLDDDNDQVASANRKALRSCALVARAFVRPSQMKLFATVNLRPPYYYQSPDERSRLFSKLLSSSPHVGQYVKNLVLSYRPARSNSLGHILLSLPKLEILSLYPWGDYRRGNAIEPFPIYHRDSFLTVFSLPSLRRLALRNQKFSDALQLQSVLSNCAGLQDLVLHNISFDDISAAIPGTSTEPPRVALKSLEFISMETDHLDAIFDLFTIVDVKHLRSFCCDRYHERIFQANAHSIQELTLMIKDPPDITYPETLSLPMGLVRLNLNTRYHLWLPVISRRLGNLAALTSLRQVSFAVGDSISVFGHFTFLSETDSLFAEIYSRLDEININLAKPSSYQSKTDVVRVVRESMPTMREKAVFNIAFVSSGTRTALMRW